MSGAITEEINFSIKQVGLPAAMMKKLILKQTIKNCVCRNNVLGKSGS
jgi:hypothetical protein